MDSQLNNNEYAGFEDIKNLAIIKPGEKRERSKSVELIYSSISFAVLFVIMLLLSLISVDAQGIHITLENIGVKSAMTAVYAFLAVSMSFIMRLNARTKFDMLPEVISLQEQISKYSDIDRIAAQELLIELQKNEYNKRREDALLIIRQYAKDFEPGPVYRKNKEYSKDINRLIRQFYNIKLYKYPLDDIINPLRVESSQNNSILALPEDRYERDKKWLTRRIIWKFTQMFFLIGLAGELVMSIVTTGAIMSTLIRIAIVVYSCTYSYMREYSNCKSKDIIRLNKSLTILKNISSQLDNKSLVQNLVQKQ